MKALCAHIQPRAGSKNFMCLYTCDYCGALVDRMNVCIGLRNWSCAQVAGANAHIYTAYRAAITSAKNYNKMNVPIVYVRKWMNFHLHTRMYWWSYGWCGWRRPWKRLWRCPILFYTAWYSAYMRKIALTRALSSSLLILYSCLTIKRATAEAYWRVFVYFIYLLAKCCIKRI